MLEPALLLTAVTSQQKKLDRFFYSHKQETKLEADQKRGLVKQNGISSEYEVSGPSVLRHTVCLIFHRVSAY